MMSWAIDRAKWDEWDKLRGVSKQEAVLRYIKLLKLVV